MSDGRDYDCLVLATLLADALRRLERVSAGEAMRLVGRTPTPGPGVVDVPMLGAECGGATLERVLCRLRVQADAMPTGWPSAMVA